MFHHFTRRMFGHKQGAGLSAQANRRRTPLARRRLLLETLEGRRLLATWTFRIDRGGDDVTLGFNAAQSRYEMRDTATGDLLGSRNAGGSLTDIRVVGTSAPDSLRIAASFVTASLPVLFQAGAGAFDTVGAQSDANMTLTSALLTIVGPTRTANVTLVGVEHAQLTGGNGANAFDVSGFGPASGASVKLMGGAGNDTYIAGCGDLAVEIEDSGGDDTYNFCGGTVVITDYGGSDDYTETYPPAGAPPETNANIEINDHVDGDPDTLEEDEYFFHGSTVVINDDGGSDVYTETFPPAGTPPDTNANIEINDGGTDNDEYFFHGSTVVITDDGGNDVYTEMLPPAGTPPETNGYIELTDRQDGDDQYFIQGSTVVVTDDGGEDTLDFSDKDNAVSLSLNDGGGTGTGSFFIFTGSFEVIVLTAFDDHYTGTVSAGITIRGLEGDDVIDLSASTGTDTIDGGPGNDVMIGGTGNTTFVETPNSADVIIDAGGIDTIDFSGASLGVKFNLSLSTGQVQNVDSAGNTVAVTGTLEIVIGSEHDDDLSGDSFDNVLVGLAGNDRLSGQSGSDVLIGGTGSDRLVGGTGEDILIAGWTSFDRNDAALRAILAEWSSGQSLEERVDNLRNGSITLANGTPIVLLKASTPQFQATVFDDLDPDRLTGSNGPDWLFFDDLLDVATDEDSDVDVINDGPVPGA